MQALPPPTPPKAVRVDVDVDALEPPHAGDAQERQEVAVGAMTRAARQPSGGGGTSSKWIETRPMVGPGLAAETEQH
jgi:hypothetical protein